MTAAEGRAITTHEKLLYCSFCGKNQHDVEVIVTDQNAAICDECVDLCNDFITEFREEKKNEQTELG